MRTLIIGDIHGRLNSLAGLLEISSYDPKKDRLICIGDYIDTGKQSYQVVDLLIRLNEASGGSNVYLMGNHDKVFLDILEYDMEVIRDRRAVEEMHWEWFSMGGAETYNSYITQSDQDIIRHRDLFYKKLKYYHEEDDKLYVHAGYDYNMTIEESYKDDADNLLWDRHLYMSAINDNRDDSVTKKFGGYDKIYIGHTPTLLYGDTTPRYRANVINVDQGCKINGTLTAWVDETDTWFQFINDKNIK
jgi:serine/threonine protein phosphatase 1